MTLERPGQQLSANVGYFFFFFFYNAHETFQELVSFNQSTETLSISASSSDTEVAIFSSVAHNRRTSMFNEWMVGYCVSVGSIDNMSIHLADMNFYSYMLCDFENVALGHKTTTYLERTKTSNSTYL